MAVDIVQPATILREREKAPDLSDVDLDVTSTALNDFCDFVQQLGETATLAAVMQENPESSKTLLRRSVRFRSSVEPDVSKSKPLPAAEVRKVSGISSSTVNFFSCRRRGRCIGHRTAIGPGCPRS